MTHIVFSRNDEEKTLALNIEGHAEYAETGKDIVCSAISILAYTLAEHLAVCYEQGIIGSPEILLNEGQTKIVCKTNKDTTYKYLLGKYAFVQLGFELIQNTYPENVKLTKM